MLKYKINLNFDSFLKEIKLKKQYIEFLQKKVNNIKNIQKINYKNLNSSLFLPLKSKKKIDNYIMYIVDITFSPTNSLLHITDYQGNLLYYYSAGLLGYKGKKKKTRFIVFKNFYKILLKQFSFLLKKPIALHLKDTGWNKFWIVQKLKKKFFIKVIKTFNSHSYNGCRKKKIRRKKFKTKKKIMKKWLSGLKRQTVNLLSILIIGSNPIFFKIKKYFLF